MYKLNICVCSYAFTQTFTYNSLITLPKHDVKDYARKLMRDTSNIVRLTEIKQLGKHRDGEYIIYVRERQREHTPKRNSK